VNNAQHFDYHGRGSLLSQPYASPPLSHQFLRQAYRRQITFEPVGRLLCFRLEAILKLSLLFEYQIANIEGTKLMPLSQFESRVSELESLKDKEIVAHCHHGGRSRQALEMLKSKGFKNLKNVAGGIHEWSVQIDSSVPQY